MRYALIICVLLTLLCVLEAVPKRGSSGRGSSGRGSSGRGSSGSKPYSHSHSQPGGSWFGGKGSSAVKGTRKIKGSTLKKAAVLGIGAYGAYQVGKLAGKFGSYGGGHRWGFNDWNDWREAEGLLCRNDNDCNWIDRRMDCGDYELKFTPSALWFDGDFASIRGECSCPEGTFFNDNELRCDQVQFGAILGTLGIIGIVVGLLSCCCCTCVCYFLGKKLLILKTL